MGTILSNKNIREKVVADWTGIVGIVFGAYGAWTGHRGYKRANEIKALDVRLELRKALSDAHGSLSELRDLIAKSERERPGINAMIGRNGGAVTAWERAIQTDKDQIDVIAQPLRSLEADFAILTPEQMERDIIATHSAKRSLGVLIEKYKSELAWDAEQRRIKTESVNAHTTAMLTKR